MDEARKAELLALQRRRVQLLREREALTKGFGLLRYRPHKKQDRFHRAGNKKRRLVMAGNRFGKSHMGSAEDCSWLMGERVFYPKTDPARTIGIPQRPVKGCVLTTDWDKVDEIWTTQTGERPGKIWQLLPQGFVKKATKNKVGVIDNIECANGSVLRFDNERAWLHNPQSGESADWDFLHIDEPVVEKMYKSYARGLVDRGGFVWFTLTALREMWIIDMFFPRSSNKRKLPEELDQDGRWVIRGTMDENPYLSREGIEEYKKELKQDEKDARILGLPLELIGLVYKQWDYDKHALKAVPNGWAGYRNPPKDWSHYIHIDPHPQTPHAVLFAAINELGQIFFYDEIFRHCVISDLCEDINARMVGRHLVRVKCDPTAWINDPITGDNMAAEFEKHGLYVEKATKALAQGIIHTQNELEKVNRIFVSPMLEEFLYEIQRYVWDEEENRPVDKDDHMMEGMYRLLMDDMTFIPRFSKSGPIEDETFEKTQLELEDLEVID